MNNGNVLVIFAIFTAIFLTIIIFIATIFTSHVNSTLYNFKLNVYSMAKSGIIAVNKNKLNTGNFSYDTNTYKKELEKMLKINYDLDDSMSNNEKLISKINIEDYKIYKSGEKDRYTNQRCDDTTLHIVLNVKIRPIIMRELLEKIYTFEIHEDVNLNALKMGGF